jgi:hypothetical protein
LLAAFDHVHGVVLGQVDVAAKTNEVPMLPVLLADIDIRGAVITADALHAIQSARSGALDCSVFQGAGGAADAVCPGLVLARPGVHLARAYPGRGDHLVH